MRQEGETEGGDAGGRVIAAGTSEGVARVKESYTGQYLRKLLGRRAKWKAQAAE
jgi:excinuclease ABC subunit A